MDIVLSHRRRAAVIGAALLALFLGALDALVMTAAMPTIVADLGGLSLYSWVYSAYFLARAVSLPIFGKLADRYSTRMLFSVSIGLFLFSSVLAGCSNLMSLLIAARVIQGIGAGGNFALVYIVLSDIAAPEKRGKTLSLASSIWGLASVLGPTLGGVIVTYFSWRWIFFINIPMGLASLVCLRLFLVEMRNKRRSRPDLKGALLLTTTILGILFFFLMGGREYDWLSPVMATIAATAVLSAILFFLVEKRAQDPMLSIDFFRIPSFLKGNLATFLSSFTVFSMFAYAPLFIQGALLKSPVEVGMTMLSLSLGWSLASLSLGQIIHRTGSKIAAAAGGILLVAGSGACLAFDAETSLVTCFATFATTGVGMGLVTLSTLLVVQNSLSSADLGVATSTHQFARTLGGAVGIGICGGFVVRHLQEAFKMLTENGYISSITGAVAQTIKKNPESLFDPGIQAALPAGALELMGEAVIEGVNDVFMIITAVSILCFIVCLGIPSGR